MNIDIIVEELKKLHKKDPIWTKDVEEKIKNMIKNDKNKLIGQEKKIVWAIYEDLKMRNSIGKVNVIAKQNEKLNRENLIGRKGKVNKKKVLFDMTWIVKQNMDKFSSEFCEYVFNFEKQLKYPVDFDIMQTAKLRDEFLYLKDSRVFFHILDKNGKEQKKSIKMEDDEIIFLSRDHVFKYSNKNNKLDQDKVYVLGLMPYDTLLYIKDGYVYNFR